MEAHITPTDASQPSTRTIPHTQSRCVCHQLLAHRRERRDIAVIRRLEEERPERQVDVRPTDTLDVPQAAQQWSMSSTIQCDANADPDLASSLAKVGGVVGVLLRTASDICRVLRCGRGWRSCAYAERQTRTHLRAKVGGLERCCVARAKYAPSFLGMEWH